MESTSLHPTPSPRVVAIEQFRAVWLALRTEAYFFLGALLLLGVLVITNAIRAMHTHPAGTFHMGFTYGAAGAVPVFAMALLIPFGVWRSEDPSRRAYHWAMPVARGPHTLVKFLSGWAWLMIGTAVYLLFIVLLATIISLITGEPNHVASGPAWEWILAFTATTLAYLITSVAVIGSDHPWRWIGGTVIGYGILIGVFRSFGMVEMAQALNTISNGRYGLNAALFGGVTEGARGITIGVTREAMATLRMSSWLVAMPLWIIGSAIAVTFASYRHRE